MRRLSIVLGMMLVLIMAGSSFAIKFTVEPAVPSVVEGQTVTLSIYLDDWTGPNNVAGIEYYITYNQNAASIVSVTEAAAWDDAYFYDSSPGPGSGSCGVVDFGAGVAGSKMLLQTVVLRCNDGNVDFNFGVNLGVDGIVMDVYGSEYTNVTAASIPINQTSSTFCLDSFDYDKDVDGTDASAFKKDFGRSALKNPCPSDGPAPVEKTGQKTSYATGDDGDLEKGVAWPNPRFTDNSNGTVTDNLTGLIWLKNANCYGTRTWAQALTDCNGLNSGECGLTDGSVQGDWRLPNSNELASLVHKGYYNPAVPNTAGTGKWAEGDPFNSVVSSLYWSSTADASSPAYAWYVRMYNGHVYVNYDSLDLYVWPVRGGQ